MKYQFHIVDVFSPKQFGGNQLAVLPNAEGISSEGMQKIAREFNFAETTFVLPPADSANTRQVRIFTPNAEIMFAGHPTVGAACALLYGQHLDGGAEQTIILEEGVGPVRVTLSKKGDVLSGMLALDPNIEVEDHSPKTNDLAEVLSLQEADIVKSFFASVGLPFCFVHLVSREAVDRATMDRRAWIKHLKDAWSSNVFFFAGDIAEGAELYARMWAPALGVEEDPATGSACAALVGVLAAAHCIVRSDTFTLSVLQGVAMGRRSEIQAVAKLVGGKVQSVGVGGPTTYVASGEIDVDREWLES